MSDPKHGWEHVADDLVTWDYGDMDLSTHLDARLTCCGLELRLLPGLRAVCLFCGKEYGIGFIRRVLVKRDSGPGFFSPDPAPTTHNSNPDAVD